MWDMTGDPFEADLSKLFRQPTGEADAARLTLGVLERMEHEERRRRVVIVGAAAAGAIIAGGAMVSSGAGVLIQTLSAQISAIEIPVVDSRMWLIAAMGLALVSFGGLFSTRAFNGS